MWTAQEGHTEVAKLLLERGADPTIKDKVFLINQDSYIVIMLHVLSGRIYPIDTS